MKLIRRTAILKNLIVYLSFSLVYLHVVVSLHEQRSALDFLSLQKLIIDNRLLLGLYLAALVTIFFAKRSSKLFTLMFLSFVFGHTFYYFLVSFDKLILLLNFAYLIFSFCFYLLWKLELDEAYYWPAFTLNDLEIRPTYNFPVKITSLRSNRSFEGHLTNCAEEACFIILKDKQAELRGEVELEVSFAQRRFVHRAQIVTAYGKGFGLRILPAQEQKFTSLNWPSFYDIINDRGYKLNMSKVYS